MDTPSGVSAVERMYTSSARSLMSALTIGLMFLLITAASLSMNGTSAVMQQIVSDRDGETGSLAAVAGALRIHREPESAGRETLLVESVRKVLSKAEHLLAEPNSMTGVDRVTLDISLHDLRLSGAGSSDTGQQLAQVLSRRMEALELRAIIRVLRVEDLSQALELAVVMLAEGTLSANQIGIGVDARIAADTLTIEIVRSTGPVKVQEPLR